MVVRVEAEADIFPQMDLGVPPALHPRRQIFFIFDILFIFLRSHVIAP